MKQLRAVAERLGLYHALRYSPAYAFILRWKNPKYVDYMHRDRAFYEAALDGREVGLVFDVGANCGDKAAVFASVAKRVVCFEPDPYSQRALRARFKRQKRVVVEGVALGEAAGEAAFHSKQPGSAYNSLSLRHRELHEDGNGTWTSAKCEVATLDDMFARHGRPQFLKVDVEGYETAVFAGMTGMVEVLSFEANLPDFRQETLALIERFLRVQPDATFNAREADRFVFHFPRHVEAEEMLRLVREATSPVSYDIFVYAPPGHGRAGSGGSG